MPVANIHFPNIDRECLPWNGIILDDPNQGLKRNQGGGCEHEIMFRNTYFHAAVDLFYNARPCC